MQILQVRQITTDSCKLGEGPLWWADAWWWIDIDGGQIHRLDPQTNKRSACATSEPVGFVMPIEGTQDAFIAGLKTGFARVDFSSGKITHLTDPEPDSPQNRFNDGKCDPYGRLFAGTLSPKPKEASFYRFHPGKPAQKLFGGATISNGLAWNEAAGEFYYVDTPTGEIVTFAYNFATGELGAKRRSTKTNPEWGHPDGMTIDAEGLLWVAFWDGRAVRRVDPATGNCLAVIELPVPRVTSCAFGGPKGDQLLITTARSAEANSGCVFLAEPGVTGASAVGVKLH